MNHANHQQVGQLPAKRGRSVQFLRRLQPIPPR
jgi:hypothetical protein